MSMNELPPLPVVEMSEKDFKKTNRRKFLTWFALGGLGVWGFNLIKGTEEERALSWPLRRIVDTEDSFWKANFDENSKAAKTVPPTKPLRVNGDIGLQTNIDMSTWRLQVSKQGQSTVSSFSLQQIKELPAVTETFELKCIEGWSQSMTCKGVRFADFMEAFGLGWMVSEETSAADKQPYAYASLSTPDRGYYVSMDIKSLMHPQTILCYELDGEPLSLEHGYPLRLVTAVKYGVKNIKRIGNIEFTSSPPADYWAENGYGEYLGL